MSETVRTSELKRELKEDLDTLKRVGCQFFACPGPNKPVEHMATCFVCSRIKELRTLIKRIRL